MTFMPPANCDSTREATRLDNAKAGRTLAPLDKSKSIISTRLMMSKVQPAVKEGGQDDSNMILINLLSANEGLIYYMLGKSYFKNLL